MVWAQPKSMQEQPSRIRVTTAAKAAFGHLMSEYNVIIHTVKSGSQLADQLRLNEGPFKLWQSISLN